MFINASLDDSDFPVDSVKQAVTTAAQVFKLRGVEQKLHAVYPEKSSGFSNAERANTYRWLDEILKKPAGRSTPPSSN